MNASRPQPLTISTSTTPFLPTSIARTIHNLHELDPEYEENISLLPSPSPHSSASPSPINRLPKNCNTLDEIQINVDERELQGNNGLFRLRELGSGRGMEIGERGDIEGRGNSEGESPIAGESGRWANNYQEKKSLTTKEKRTNNKLKEKLLRFYNNNTMLGYGFLSLVVLFAYDMKRAYFFNEKYNVGFDVIMGIIMGVFLIENIINAIVKESLHFFYFMDLIATLTIILDFTTINKYIYQ